MGWDWTGWDWKWLIVFFVAGTLIWEIEKLKKYIHIDDLTPKRKWKKRFDGPKVLPKHKPDEVSEYASEADRRFYRDFAPVADYLNNTYEDGPWGFQNNGKLETSLGSSVEREIEIWYNQNITGWIKVSCIDYGHERYSQSIRVELNLINARIYEGFEVMGLAMTIAQVVIGTAEESQEAKASIQNAMIAAMWQIGPDVFGNPEIEFSATGKAEWFLSLERDTWKKAMAQRNAETRADAH